MNAIKLTNLVDEAIALQRRIAELEDHAKSIRNILIVEARSREEEQTATDGGGKSWVATGSDGSIARVTFPARTLRPSIDAEKPAGAKIMQVVGRHKDELFRPLLKYVPVENFRDRARELLGKAAEKVIQACETESAPKVGFEIKEG